MTNHIFPTLRYRDAKGAIDFLERAFGFDLVASHENEDGTIAHAEMRWGESMIMFGHEGEEQIERFGPSAGRGSSYVTVDDPDAHHDRAKAAGAEVTMELVDQDYGSREYQARDPEGNAWSFGTYDPLNA